MTTLTNDDSLISSLLLASTTTTTTPSFSSSSSSTTTTPLKCPTRLLIRRRSLQVVEEGGGTHIYAIRYPDDSSQLIVSEPSTNLSALVRQEQCPPRKSKHQQDNDHDDHDHDDGGKIISYQPCQQQQQPHLQLMEPPHLKMPTLADPSLLLLSSSSSSQGLSHLSLPENVGDLFAATSMAAPPRQNGK
jgi:hypothetical protein